MRFGSTPFIFWPFVAIWNLLEVIFKLTGRLVAAILGLVIMIAGAALCVTIIGTVIGIPLIAFGFAMMIRGFF